MKTILLILAVILSGQGFQQPAATDKLAKLQGTWIFLSLEVEGSKLPEAMLGGSKIIINRESFKSISAGITYEGTICVD